MVGRQTKSFLMSIRTTGMRTTNSGCDSTKNPPPPQVEMKALDELIANKLPKLHAHLVATECDISLIATDW